MNLKAILSKTAKGLEEIETRRHKLDQRSRALLIVVNGKSSAAELLKKFEQMGDVITGQIEACRSAQDLKNYLDTKRAMLEAALGRKAAPFWAKAKELLG